MTHLASLTVRGFKTIRDLTEFPPGQITMLIGPNGAGKSNLLSFFRLLSRAVAPPGGLQAFVAEQGGGERTASRWAVQDARDRSFASVRG